VKKHVQLEDDIAYWQVPELNSSNPNNKILIYVSDNVDTKIV
jgi:hypothetical protein